MPLWKHIFLYAFMLALLSMGLSFCVFKFTEENYLSPGALKGIASALANSLENESLETTLPFIKFFDPPTRALWFESPDGHLLKGEVLAGLEPENRQLQNSFIDSGYQVDIMRGNSNILPLLARVRIDLQDDPVVMYLALDAHPAPLSYRPLLQGFLTVIIICGALSLWMARWVGAPLRRLRDEVLELAGGNLQGRVTERAWGEISEVARAVNQLAGSLSQNITYMRELLANISHEIRSPLARMSVTATLMEDIIQPKGSLHHSTNQLKDCRECCPEKAADLMAKNQSLLLEIENLSRLVGDSLLTSKLDLRQQDILYEPVAFSELTTEMCRRHKSVFDGRRLAFHTSIKENLWVRGDEGLLCQVLANMLDNAAKYTDENGVVSLRLRGSKKEVCLELENTYQKQPPEVLAQLIAPFYRGGMPTGDGKGVGLGLSLVDKIIKSHKGLVGVSNGNTGILFTVTMPRTYPS